MKAPTSLSKFNNWLAVRITSVVGTMTCAYVFAGLAVWGGTAVNWHNSLQVVQWISQTFLQLVLLSIIMVGQRLLSQASDKQNAEMHDAVMEELKIARDELKELRTLNQQFHSVIEQLNLKY